MQASTAADRMVLHGIRHNIRDWKLGYMEASFEQISNLINVLYEKFVLDNFRTSIGHTPSMHDAIDPAGAQVFHKGKIEERQDLGTDGSTL